MPVMAVRVSAVKMGMAVLVFVSVVVTIARNASGRVRSVRILRASFHSRHSCRRFILPVRRAGVAA